MNEDNIDRIVSRIKDDASIMPPLAKKMPEMHTSMHMSIGKLILCIWNWLLFTGTHIYLPGHVLEVILLRSTLEIEKGPI